MKRRWVLEKNENESVYIDVETTGLSPETDEIVEVCAIKFDNRTGENLDIFYSLCKPISGIIPEAASNIHGITIDKVVEKPNYIDIRKDLGNFIGKRTVIGHNLISFDIKFLKIRPVEVEDTLMMCRKRWKSKNKLSLACRRMKIRFSEDQAHGAEYDVRKGIELYMALKALDDPSVRPPSLFESKPEQATAPMPTQVYSYSRINLFHQCPFKWKQVYLLKNREPESIFLVVGKTVHKICELAAIWAYAETFANKFNLYVKKFELTQDRKILDIIQRSIEKDHPFYLPDSIGKVSWKNIGMFLYLNPGYMKEVYGKTIVEVLNYVSANHTESDYETISMPDRETYNQLIQYALVIERCKEPDHIKDVQWLADWFYGQKDFTLYSGEMALVEKKLNFDKNWNLLPDFFDDNGYMRGVLDVVEYNGTFVTIIDYKTGRKMLTEEELKHDLQMKVYVLLT
ncbi:MAG TPA: exonuclease domain-containing protein, partial [Bacteroidales bacterium]|nr:exonuclease domain-containing protein [Bacteroidales bacterium]